MRVKLPRLIVALLVVALFGGVASASFAASMTTSATFVGYLMDIACGASGKGVDGSDVVNSPWDHSKMCLTACKASGFGLMVRQGDKYIVIKFDKAGSDLALKEIVNKTKRDNDIVVSVDGILKDGVLTVQSIKEANLLGQL